MPIAFSGIIVRSRKIRHAWPVGQISGISPSSKIARPAPTAGGGLFSSARR